MFSSTRGCGLTFASRRVKRVSGSVDARTRPSPGSSQQHSMPPAHQWRRSQDPPRARSHFVPVGIVSGQRLAAGAAGESISHCLPAVTCAARFRGEEMRECKLLSSRRQLETKA
ncbi:hypothetical protein BD626DRAFT_493046 [Schizophyllum amplum]|uniref:Uncharacterized protein n=1 Tax=Schizophyllum amplum TaxID=97359 RepID=A0A550CGF4_9AGAR|nr:hypothetical protein BD626DRAFT_493046 [Auriculariopsis ampla]